MGSTLRDHRYQVPMPTRSTDISLADQCFGRWVLTLFYEQEQADASFFILGDILHRGIERAILDDLDTHQTWAWVSKTIDEDLGALGDNRKIESSKRGFDTMMEDAARMLTNWFKFVHPDSSKRHPIYDDYMWPPVVERRFERPAEDAGTRYPVWGSIDAHFLGKHDGDTNAIVDWKSGTQKQKTDFQLQFYRFGSGARDARAWFHHLDRVRKPAMIQEADPYPGDEEMLELVLNAENLKIRVLNGKTPKFNPDWYCNYCPVQEFCPEDGDPRNRKANRRSLERMVELAKPLTVVKRKD